MYSKRKMVDLSLDILILTLFQRKRKKQTSKVREKKKKEKRMNDDIYNEKTGLAHTSKQAELSYPCQRRRESGLERVIIRSQAKPKQEKSKKKADPDCLELKINNVNTVNTAKYCQSCQLAPMVHNLDPRPALPA